ncbi:hypothetical protein G9F71_026605 [Clostridium sp. FP2]|uniref:hypothetical protein n=1 Tax=Clostridium sp. FP2 TaxID=2724481 RepID=UPI0013E93472|nr:hypothetical protein [Clostridium sp. FP2]MBZ9626378.1 hypothetical protein [Clostridium sp. FP2]
MKNIKKFALAIAVVSVLSSSMVFAAVTTKTPADILAGLTGKTVEQVTKDKAAGKTYGAMVGEAGKLDEFKIESLKQKKAVLDQRVKDGKLTQAKADEIYNSIKTNQANCDGTGSASIGKMNGVGFGQGEGKGMGKGSGQGNGAGCGLGMKQGNQN